MSTTTNRKFRTRLEFSKAGLVFSGGATKAAAFHIGVCLALRDKGFSFVGGTMANPPPPNSLPFPKPRFHPHQISTYVGSSAGAIVVAMLAGGIGIESIINSFSKSSQFRIPGNFKELPALNMRDVFHISWPKPSALWKSFQKSGLFAKSLESLVLKNLRLPGLFSTKGIADYVRQILVTDNFHELKADLFIIATQLDHSRKIVFGRYGTHKTFDTYFRYSSNAFISDAVGASMSLPPLFVPYLIHHPDSKDRYYIDGEIRETLSTHVAKENNCDLLICSYTHQPYHYKEETGSLYDYGMSAICVQALYQMIEQKIYGSQKGHDNKLAAMATVRKFFRDKKYPAQDLQELIEILQDKLDFKENLHYIYIHPEAKDREMFFGDHFTLNSETLQNVVTIGYRRAMSELRRYDLIAK